MTHTITHRLGPQPYPTDRTARRERRQQVAADILDQAEAIAILAGRSAKCSGFDGLYNEQHARQPGGCHNDGSGCLCECHD